ncbi:MAG: hypothetical protein HY219_02005 [Candidatus Staskawiczbacteria bacterium]|nr:hypothetical protein [Candidatus Staskawiczbacteria bacterium]
MDFNFFSIFNKLRENKLWWVDVVFYFVISSLIATILCYLIFAIKIYDQKKKIEDFRVSLATVGTDEQKDMEKQIFDYQKKISDYSPLIKEHRVFSNIFAYLEKNTLPNVWFSRFNMEGKDANIILSGETENSEIFSRQISIFEASEYLTKITVLGSMLGDQNKTNFNLVLSLDPKIFSFAPKSTPIVNPQAP